jgi:hypothetical protein
MPSFSHVLNDFFDQEKFEKGELFILQEGK